MIDCPVCAEQPLTAEPCCVRAGAAAADARQLAARVDQLQATVTGLRSNIASRPGVGALAALEDRVRELEDQKRRLRADAEQDRISREQLQAENRRLQRHLTKASDEAAVLRAARDALQPPLHRGRTEGGERPSE